MEEIGIELYETSFDKPVRFQSPSVHKVILSQETRGNGTAQDHFRSVIMVHTLDGRLIAESDPFTRPTNKGGAE